MGLTKIHRQQQRASGCSSSRACLRSALIIRGGGYWQGDAGLVYPAKVRFPPVPLYVNCADNDELLAMNYSVTRKGRSMVRPDSAAGV
jgi:hypothetical protein